MGQPHDDRAGAGLTSLHPRDHGAYAVVPPATPTGVAPPALAALPGFEVIAELGRGGMGVVYKARQPALGRLCAVKVLLQGNRASEDEKGRFHREALAAAKVSHPNIVQVFEVGECAGEPYLAMEYVEGGSLEKLLGRPLGETEAARSAESLARAVHAAHQAGVIHRDLKPSNVLIGADGTLKVGDFGLARLAGASRLTASGAVAGTPNYMAPEQAAGQAGEVNRHTDVYALGAILYEMLTGRPPFEGTTWMATLQAVLLDDPVPVRQRNDRVSRDLEAICLKCLAKQPQDRYPDALSLAEDLARFLRGVPVDARKLDPLRLACRRLARIQGGTVALTVLILLLTRFFAANALAWAGQLRTADRISELGLDLHTGTTIGAILGFGVWAAVWLRCRPKRPHLRIVAWAALLGLLIGVGGWLFTLEKPSKEENPQPNSAMWRHWGL